MGTRIIMIRHGYSVSNNLKFFTGQSDIELNEIGCEQARLCGEYFKPFNVCSACGEAYADRIWERGISRIDAIYSSDLSRAYDTALEVGRALGIDVVRDSRLREIYAGAWEMMPFAELDAKYPEEYGVWKNDIGRAVCTGGESVSALSDRIKRAVESIAAVHDGGCAVIVTHATPIRVICTLAKGLEPSEMGRVSWVSNASISIFDYDGAFHELETNITSHLGSLKTDLPRGV